MKQKTREYGRHMYGDKPTDYNKQFHFCYLSVLVLPHEEVRRAGWKDGFDLPLSLIKYHILLGRPPRG